MNKKTLIIIVATVLISALITLGTVFLYLNMQEKKENGPEYVEEVDVNKIDYTTLKEYPMGSLSIQISPEPESTKSKSHYLLVDLSIYVTDDETLAMVSTLGTKIKDVVLGVFETKTASELEGNREVMKQVVLDNVREIFVKASDKEKIIDVLITKYMIAEQ